MALFGLWAGVLGAAGSAASAAPAAPPTASSTAYTVEDLGANFEPYSMNTAGIIVGEQLNATTGTTALDTWQNGTEAALPLPAAPSGYTVCGDAGGLINAAGVIAGAIEFCTADGSFGAHNFTTPFVWEPGNGGYANPVAAGPETPGLVEGVVGLNNAGDLLIEVNPTAEAAATLQVTGPDGGSPQTVPNGYYGVGMISAGQFAYVDHSGVSRIASVADPSTSSTLAFAADATSDNGYIVGTDNNRTTIVLRSPTGTLTHPPGDPSGNSSDTSVNSSGNIVTDDPAFVPLGATTTTPIANLFPAGSGFDTTDNTIYVRGLNDNNDIFGYDYYPADPNQADHGFVLIAPSANPPVVNSTADTAANNDGAKGCDTGKTVHGQRLERARVHVAGGDPGRERGQRHGQDDHLRVALRGGGDRAGDCVAGVEGRRL